MAEDFGLSVLKREWLGAGADVQMDLDLWCSHLVAFGSDVLDHNQDLIKWAL